MANTTFSVLGSIFVVVITTLRLTSSTDERTSACSSDHLVDPKPHADHCLHVHLAFHVRPGRVWMINKMLAAIGLPGDELVTSWSMQLCWHR